MFPHLSQMKYLPTQWIEEKERRKSACSRGMFSVLGPTIAEDRQHARARHRTTFFETQLLAIDGGPTPGARGGGGRTYARTPSQPLAPGTGTWRDDGVENGVEAYRPADQPRPYRSGSAMRDGRHRGTIEGAGYSSGHRHRLVGGGSQGAFVELHASATVPGKRRGITIYQRVYPLLKLGHPQAERAWFAHAERLNWGWIGRVRRGVHLGCATASDRWCFTSTACWFKKASGKARRASDCRLTKKAAWPCYVVSVRRPRAKRKSYHCPGHGSTPKVAREARVSAREPWLLVHDARLCVRMLPSKSSRSTRAVCRLRRASATTSRRRSVWGRTSAARARLGGGRRCS